MDSLCDNLIVAIFQFVHPNDRFRFIMLGKKYYNAVSNYIITPEWIYDQIDQFIKKNVVADFALRCDAPAEYRKYLRSHASNKCCRYCRCGRSCAGVDKYFVQQLGINTMICQYENGNDELTECCGCDSCDWFPQSAPARDWEMNSMQNAPPNCSSLNDQDYRKSIISNIEEQSSVRYYAYWSATRHHASNIIIAGRDEIIEYARSDTCIGGSITPIHSVYESIGIIVHNMTNIKQIHKNLTDYDIEHLQLFYIVNFIASDKVPGLLNGSWYEQYIDALRYSMFVERILQNRIRKNVEMLMMTNRIGPAKYIFMVHPEIDSKAADAAKYLILFGTE
jgi:hypothetical protein